MTKLVKQKKDYDCVLACVSMLTGRKYEDLFSKELCDRVDETKGCTDELFYEVLNVAGFERNINMKSLFVQNVDPVILENLLWKRKAILQVDSLNYKDGQHCIYWDGEQILDPSKLQVYKWWQSIHPVYVYIFD